MVELDCVNHEVQGLGTVTFATDFRAEDDYSRSVRETFRAEPPVMYTIQRLKHGEQFIDIGANIGVFSLPAAKVGAHVLAVEALPSNYFLLSIAAEKNNFTNLQVLNAAAYDRSCTVAIHGESAWGTIIEGVAGQEVLAMKMDDLIARHGFDNAKLVKLDVEGCELKALHGLDRFISRANDLELIIEINEPACRRAGYTGNELLTYLEEREFKLFAFGDGVLSPRKATGFRESYCMDFLAVKNSAPWSPPKGFIIEPTARKDIFQLVKVMLVHENSVCGDYMLDAITNAPAWVAEEAEISALLAMAQLKARQRTEDAESPNAQPKSNTVERVNKKIAIVASESKLCGIASYARQLSRNLGSVFEVIHVPLDQTTMRDPSTAGKKLANELIDQAADVIKSCDWVNIHLEPGTFGNSKSEIISRFERLVEASPKLIITFHSMARAHPPHSVIKIANLVGGSIGQLLHRYAAQHLGPNDMWKELLHTLKRYEANHDLFLLTHTPADKKYLTMQLGFKHAEDHPLCYLTKSDVLAIKANQKSIKYRAELVKTKIQLDAAHAVAEAHNGTRINNGDANNGTASANLQKQTQTMKFIGAFGFISPYKGLTCTVKALSLLPDDYTLVIAGSIHPFNHIDYKQGDDHLLAIQELVEKHGLQHRVIFRPSAETDEEFIESIAAADAVVCSYLEYGQSGSGPAQLAIELERPLICTKTQAFTQLAEYFPGRVNLIDVGNHIHLAQMIQQTCGGLSQVQQSRRPRSVETCTEIYRQVIAR